MADKSDDENNGSIVDDVLSSLDFLDDFSSDDFRALVEKILDDHEANAEIDIQPNSPSQANKRALTEVEDVYEVPAKRVKKSSRYEDLLGEEFCRFNDELQEMKGTEVDESKELVWIKQYLETVHRTSDPIEVFTWIVDTFAEIPPGEELTALKELASVLGLTDLVTYLNHLPYLPVSTSKLQDSLDEAKDIEKGLKTAEDFILTSNSGKRRKSGAKKTKKAVKTGEPERARQDLETLLAGATNGNKRFRLALVGKMQTSKSRIAQAITGVKGLSGDTNKTSGTTTVPLLIVPTEIENEYYVDFYLNDQTAIKKRQARLQNRMGNLEQLYHSLKTKQYEEDLQTFAISTLKSAKKQRNTDLQFKLSAEPDFKELLLCRVLYSPVKLASSPDTHIEVLDFPGYNDTACPELCKAYAATLLSIPNFIDMTALCIQNRGATEPDDIKFLLDAGVFDLHNPHIVVAYWSSDDSVNPKSKEHSIRKEFRNQLAALFGVKPTQGTVINAALNKEILGKSSDIIDKYRVHKWLSYTCQSIAWGQNSVNQLIQLVNTARLFNMQLGVSRYFDSLKFKCLDIKGMYRNDLIGLGKFKTAREQIDKYLKEERFRTRVRQWKEEFLTFMNDESNSLNALPGMLGMLIERCSNAYRMVSGRPNLSDVEKLILSVYEITELKLKQESLQESLEDLDREKLKHEFSSIADDLLETNGTELLKGEAKGHVVQALIKSRIQRKQTSYMKRINKLIRGGKTVADYAKALSQVPWGQNSLLLSEVDSLVIAVIDPKDAEAFRQNPMFQQPFSQNNRLVFLVAPADCMGLGRVRSLMLLLAYSLDINYFWMIDDDVDTENIQEWDAISETVSKSSLSRALCYTQNIMRWEIAGDQEARLKPVTHEELKLIKGKALQDLTKQWGIIGSLSRESRCNAIVNKSNALQQLQYIKGRKEFIQELVNVDGALRMRELWKKYPKKNFDHVEVTRSWSTAAKQEEICNDPSLVLTNLPKKSDIDPDDAVSLETLAWVKKGLCSRIDLVAQVALWNRHSISQKCRYEDLIKTDMSHYLANVRRQVVLFNASAMNDLLYVNDEEFFLPPPGNWRQIKQEAEKDKQKKSSDMSKLAMKLGYHFDDFFLAEQLFYIGKNGFQTIRFSFIGKMWPSTFVANDQLDVKGLIDDADLIQETDWKSPKFNYAIDVLRGKLASCHITINSTHLWEVFAKHHFDGDETQRSSKLMDTIKAYPLASAKKFEENKNLSKASKIKNGTLSRLIDLEYLVSGFNCALRKAKKPTIGVCVLWLENNKLTISIVGVRKYVTKDSLLLVYQNEHFYEIVHDAPQQVPVDPAN